MENTEIELAGQRRSEVLLGTIDLIAKGGDEHRRIMMRACKLVRGECLSQAAEMKRLYLPAFAAQFTAEAERWNLLMEFITQKNAVSAEARAATEDPRR